MSNYQEATGKSIDDAFTIFHNKNPRVYEVFLEQCLRAVSLKRTKISAKQIIGYVRWHVSMTTETTDGFKINDAFTSRYARLFADKYPQYKDLFNYRELRSGTETIKKQFLTHGQIDVLKKCNNGYIVKLSNYIEVAWEGGHSHQIDQLTFNRLLKVDFIINSSDSDKIITYRTTEKAKKYLQSIEKAEKTVVV